MKIRSLLLGSLAAAGLSTAGFAADLGVVTSLDVCDELGLSGLTISSDDNCLVITGGVTYEYAFGSYAPGAQVIAFDGAGIGATTRIEDSIAPGLDASSDVDAWLKFVASADSDFGLATATIKLISENNTGTSDWSVGIDEAWVGIGDTTMIMAGYKSSIFADGDDVPLNYLGLFLSDKVDKGVGFTDAAPSTGGTVIQVVSNLGNGLSVGVGAEALGKMVMLQPVPSLVGVISYAGDGIAAHASGAIDRAGAWKVHSGFTGTWDPISVVGAVAADSSGYWNALGSVKATFDMFTLAASAEATNMGEWGVGGSISATVTDGVTINLGSKYFQDTTGTTVTAWQSEAGISALVTETVTLSAAVGYLSTTDVAGNVFYGKAGVAWAPGGGFDLSLNGEANSSGAYKGTFKASKSIK